MDKKSFFLIGFLTCLFWFIPVDQAQSKGCGEGDPLRLTDECTELIPTLEPIPPDATRPQVDRDNIPEPVPIPVGKAPVKAKGWRGTITLKGEGQDTRSGQYQMTGDAMLEVELVEDRSDVVQFSYGGHLNPKMKTITGNWSWSGEEMDQLGEEPVFFTDIPIRAGEPGVGGSAHAEWALTAVEQ